MSKTQQPQYRSDEDIMRELDELYPPEESESANKTIH